jgi:hypothetical protein
MLYGVIQLPALQQGIELIVIITSVISIPGKLND